MTARELLALAKSAIAAAAGRARVLVNDRLDVALAAGAAGVHLRGSSVPAGEVVRWLRSGNAPSDFMVGVSCHSLDEAREAERSGANYVFFGPVFDTPAKKEFRCPAGNCEVYRSVPRRSHSGNRDRRGERSARPGVPARRRLGHRRNSDVPGTRSTAARGRAGQIHAKQIRM